MIGITRGPGFDELDRAFARLETVASEAVLARALKRAAEPMRLAMAAHARRSKGPGPHLADHMLAEITDQDPDENGLVVEVGPEHSPTDFFYGYFQEFGTTHSAAHPFGRPAFDETVAEVLKILRSVVWDEMQRELSR